MSAVQPMIRGRIAAILLTGVIVLSVVGFLVGLYGTALERRSQYDPGLGLIAELPPTEPTSATTPGTAIIPATAYSEMRRRESGPTSQWVPHLEPIPEDYDFHHCLTCHDPHSSETRSNEASKLDSLAIRATRRAYNGSPPVIPHAIEQTDDAGCYACHGLGARVGDRVANRMSHGFLTNCLQCHAAPPPKALAQFAAIVDNQFAGLPAPVSAPRAFDGAPPVIPHSTWMRETCLSCHGGDAGWPGLDVPHRWRTDCLQCHAITSPLDSPELVRADASASQRKLLIP